MKDITKATRLANFIVDITVVYLLWVIWTLIAYSFNLPQTSIESFGLIMFSYYFFMELILQQTLGKLLTQTKVVDRFGSKPSFYKIFIRSLTRLTYIFWVHNLLGTEKSFHDYVSFTSLRKINKQN